MAYPFKSREHRVYQNTFLKDVRIAVEFDSINKPINQSILQDYFNRFDGANIKAEDFLKTRYINVFSGNRTIDFKLSLDSAEAKLCAPFYTSFNDASIYWQYLTDYLNAIGVDVINRLTVRKFNDLCFKSNIQNYDIREVMSGLFCNELMKQIPSDLSNDTTLNSFEKTMTISDEESETVFNVVFGIRKADCSEDKDHLTLVTSIKSTSTPFSTGEFMKKAEDYNQILFDAFHWCVKETIINKMK